MNTYLKKIDLFGISIPFTFYGKNQYNSSCGGIFTIITILITIFLTIQEMAPIYKRLDPSVFEKTIDKVNFSYYNLNYTNFPIAFRFEDESKTVRNLEGLVYTYVELIHLSLDEKTGNMNTKEKKLINYGPCTEDLIDSTYYPNINGFKCLNFSDFNINIGGSLYSKDTIYFKITVFYCKQVNGTSENCTDYTTLSNILSGKKKIYFSLLVPDVSINPDDFYKPLTISVDSYFNTLSPLVMRTDRYYYNYIELQQDSGFIFKHYKNFNGFSFRRKDIEYQLRTIEEYQDPNKIKTLSTNVFAIQRRISNTKVVFKKLQNGLAEVGGLFKLLSFIFITFNSFIIDDFKFFRLIDDIYDIKISKKNFTQNISKRTLKHLEDNFKHLRKIPEDTFFFKGIYINVNNLKLKNYYKNELIDKKESCYNSKNMEDLLYLKKNLINNKDNLTIECDKIYTNIFNNNKPSVKSDFICFNKNSNLTNPNKDNLINSNLNSFINENSKNKMINGKNISNLEKYSFRDRDSTFNDLENLNKKEEYSNIILQNNIANNLNHIKFGNCNLNNNQDININKNDDRIYIQKNFNNENIYELEKTGNIANNLIDYYHVRLKDIFNVIEKIKIFLCRNKKNKNNNFKLYNEGKEKIAERIDMINYLKMSFKFQELINFVEKKRVHNNLYNFEREIIIFEK